MPWAELSADDSLDENRARVVQAGTIMTLMSFLSDSDLLPYALAVIYNNMVDYGKGQYTLFRFAGMLTACSTRAVPGLEAKAQHPPRGHPLEPRRRGLPPPDKHNLQDLIPPHLSRSVPSPPPPFLYSYHE